MTTQPAVGQLLQAVLEDCREQINQKVRGSLRQNKTLDAADFVSHISDFVNPIVECMSQNDPVRGRQFVWELIELTFELFRANQLISQSGSLAMRRLWVELLPAITASISDSPKKVVGQLCNALIFMENHGESIAHQWIDRMKSQKSLIADPETLLRIGKIAAWMSGLAAYRQTAIAEAKLLCGNHCASLFAVAEHRVDDLLHQFESNPWAKPAGDTKQRTPTPRIRWKCCGFQGFGGELRFPPHVGLIDHQIVVCDGEIVWNLFADSYGWMTVRTNHRATDIKMPYCKSPVVQPKGLVRWGEETTWLEELRGCTSHAYDGQTLAVTTETSFHVYLVTNS